MKLSVAATALLVATSEAFSPALVRDRLNTRLAASRVDSSSLVQEALEISKKFGASSPEARLAWESVEEVRASDNSEATKGSLDDCDIESVDDACLEYGKQLDELANLMKTQRPNIQAMKEMAESVKQVKLATPAPVAGVDSEQLEKALAEARTLTAKLGLESPEAKLAWEAVEEIAAAGVGNSLGGVLTEDECLVDAAIEACAALEELNRLLEDRFDRMLQ